ncbi:hypothetical protein NPIL_656701 [Nephila pilipes]|uniref:Uncharacterized protein n=1 Tax=Nephila pilipes TaxID=299642 RepID=A0A8X6IX05_NEPPI|nr:hypothetical protein NPIL_656701 [Nephila pilipes]
MFILFLSVLILNLQPETGLADSSVTYLSLDNVLCGLVPPPEEFNFMHSMNSSLMLGSHCPPGQGGVLPKHYYEPLSLLASIMCLFSWLKMCTLPARKLACISPLQYENNYGSPER